MRSKVAYKFYTGEYEVYTTLPVASSVPSHTHDAGEPTYHIPAQLPIWEALTSVKMYTYYATADVKKEKVVGTTLHPLGDAHFSIYLVHPSQ